MRLVRKCVDAEMAHKQVVHIAFEVLAYITSASGEGLRGVCTNDAMQPGAAGQGKNAQVKGSTSECISGQASGYHGLGNNWGYLYRYWRCSIGLAIQQQWKVWGPILMIVLEHLFEGLWCRLARPAHNTSDRCEHLVHSAEHERPRVMIHFPSQAPRAASHEI